MKLTHLANQRVVIARLTPVGANSKLALTTVTFALGHLQPLGLEKTMAIAGVPGKTYRLYLDKSDDIKENDQLKDESGFIYTVRKGGVTRWQHGAMDYQEVYLTRT
jgi:hypothetical protein